LEEIEKIILIKQYYHYLIKTKMSKTKIDNIENRMSSLEEQLLEFCKKFEHSINSIDEKLSLIMKRQDDIEEKILYRIEKNDTISSDISSDPKSDTKTIVLKNKTDTKPEVKKSRKKVTDEPQVFKRGNVNMKVYKDLVLLTGETFDRKELIKTHGGKWDAANKGWTVPSENSEKLRKDLEKYCESLEYDETNEYLKEEPKKKEVTSSKSLNFNTCMIDDDDDD
jgi:hypothetical protein